MTVLIKMTQFIYDLYRFQKFWMDPQLIVAASVHPHFCGQAWCEDHTVMELAATQLNKLRTSCPSHHSNSETVSSMSSSEGLPGLDPNFF